jgi:hypothetical protein
MSEPAELLTKGVLVKMTFLVLLLCLIPALLIAYDLNEIARKERARRQELATSRRGAQVRAFNDADLEVYHRLRDDSAESRKDSRQNSRWKRPKRRALAPSWDLVEERAHWQKEKSKHERERARLDAGIRRLEWRLAERKAKRRPGERLRKDATEEVLEDSLASLREQRTRFIDSFHERARKAGALPGWLR